MRYAETDNHRKPLPTLFGKSEKEKMQSNQSPEARATWQKLDALQSYPAEPEGSERMWPLLDSSPGREAEGATQWFPLPHWTS